MADIQPDTPKRDPLRYSICVSGAASGETVEQDKHLAERLGAAIARRGHVTTTGATVGLPFHAAVGAKKAGGMSIGFSPASGIRDHLRRYRLPRDYFDYINYTGMNYIGRDIHLIMSSDAVVTVGGRFGSLHEFATALEAHKPCGVLLGSGGTADIVSELLRVLEPPEPNNVIFDENPENLIARITEILDKDFKDIHDQLARDEHWYLTDDHGRLSRSG